MWRRDFYPRSPCGERLYQHSTIGSTTADFYPRSPCGERRASCRPQGLGKAISIHALLAESDYWRMAAVAGCDLFLSTLSLRRATPVLIVRGSAKLYFYPRSPCGERHIFMAGICFSQGISIHALLAESDQTTTNTSTTEAISIHALLAESDPFSRFARMTRLYFYPRSPCGERQDVFWLPCQQ